MSIPELIALSRRLEGSDPHDRAGQQRLLPGFHELSAVVRGGAAPELASFLEIASRLVEALAGPGDGFDRDEVHEIACRVVATVEKSLECVTLPATDGPPPAETEDVATNEPPHVSVPEPAPWRDPIKLEEEEPCDEPSEEDERPETDSVLGRMLIAMGHVTRAQVAEALRMHRAKGLRIGECLLLLGAISPERLLHTLKIQEQLRREAEQERRQARAAKEPEKVLGPPMELRPQYGAPPPAKGLPPRPEGESATVDLRTAKHMFLGEVLLGAEMVTKQQLEAAMHLHHYEGIRVGEALIRIGALTEEELASGLELQKQLRIIAGLSR